MTRDLLLYLSPDMFVADPTADVPQAHLRIPGGVSILGTMHHVQAEMVTRDGDGTQVQVDPDGGPDLDKVYDAVAGDGPWATVEINGRSYVLIITPFCD